MYTFRVDSVELTTGLTFEPSNLTVVVGPNNSGKSRFLYELHQLLTRGSPRGRKVVSSISLHLPASAKDLVTGYHLYIEAPYQLASRSNHYSVWAMNSRMKGSGGRNLGEDWQTTVNAWLGLPPPKASAKLATAFGEFLVVYMSTAGRLHLAKKKHSGSGLRAHQNPLEAAKDDDQVTEILGRWVASAFGLPLQLARVRSGGWYSKPLSFTVEVPGNDSSSAGAMALDQQGDGIRSFVGVALGLLIEKRPVVLIDEPEAFLHPPQAYRLGEIIADQAGGDRQIFVSTHSADLLRGMLSRRSDMSIVRLARGQREKASVLLDAETVSEIERSPLLRSSRVLDGLFTQAVVVVESDSDQLFYELATGQISPGADVHYINAHGKHAIHKVTQAFRKLGTSVAAIADFDLLRDEDHFRRLLSSLTDADLSEVISLRTNIQSEINKTSPDDRLRTMRSGVQAVLDSWPAPAAGEESRAAVKQVARALQAIADDGNAWTPFKRHGYAHLTRTAQDACSKLLQWCSDHGLFIVPTGELESLMVEHGLAATSNKNLWIREAIETLTQLQPDSERLPWSFISQIQRYLARCERDSVQQALPPSLL